MRYLILAVATALLALARPVAATIPGRPAEAPVPGLTRAPELHSPAPAVETVVGGLDHPWCLQWLPDGRMLVTERAGRLRIVDPSRGKGDRLSPPVAGVPKVAAVEQGGLWDAVPGPSYRSDGLVYLSWFERRTGGYGLTVGRAKLDADQAHPRLEALTILLRAEPASDGGANLGGRLMFGRDGKLYITVGDRFDLRDQAQSLASDLGKLLRLNPDGSVPRDNPFVGRAGARPEIWTLGHRNPEGLAIDPATGVLWELEHGARGGDEINVPERGKNYGWPVITYGVDYSGAKIGVGTNRPGLEQPVYYWDPSIAPSGLSFYDGKLFPAWRGSLFVGALKWKRLIRLTLRGRRVTGEEELLGDLHERIRDVRQGPDGALYVLTDNDQGRVLRLTPK